MRRPALHHPRPAALRAEGAGWSHPYAPAPYAPLYADGGDPPAHPAPPATPPAADPPKPGPPAGKTFTQADLDAIAAKEKDQGKRAGARAALEDFAKEHGFTTVDDAKTFIAAARKAQEDALSEQEKREREVAERERRAEEREKAAAARERAAARRAVLVGLGATGDDLEDAVALLRVDDDADETAVTEAAGKLKERRPELFGQARPPADGTPPAAPPAPGGAPAGGPPPRTPATKTDAKTRAHERAVKMGYAKPDAA